MMSSRLTFQVLLNKVPFLRWPLKKCLVQAAEASNNQTMIFPQPQKLTCGGIQSACILRLLLGILQYKVFFFGYGMWVYNTFQPIQYEESFFFFSGLLEKKTFLLKGKQGWNILSSSFKVFIYEHRWLSGKESACYCRRCGFNPWVEKISPEKEMITYYSILAWKIPWTEEPGGLQPMRLQKSWTQLSV